MNAHAPQNCDLLIENAFFLNSQLLPEHRGHIAIKDGRILDIGDAPDAFESSRKINGRGLLWMPGLVDGHTHTSQQLLRGRLLDEKPVIWKRINVPFEAGLTEETSRLSAQLAALEMIRSGTTSFVDAGGRYVDVFAEIYEKSGLRCGLTRMTTDAPGVPEMLRSTPKEAVRQLRELHRTIEGRGEGRMKVFFSVTALTACSEETIRSVFSEALSLGVPVEVHMNEYPSEVFDFMERYGKRPFEYLEDEGLLGPRFLAPHCIFLSQEETDILARNAVRVAHCPFSNCGKGVPNTPQLLQKGIGVGFGTDGSAHGGLDLFREIRLFRSIMNAHHGTGSADPQVMPARTLLSMATRGGAAPLLDRDIGTIEAGNTADLIALDIDQPHILPTQNLIHTVVESVTGSDVTHSIVNGRLLMRNRRVLTLDEERIMSEARTLPWLNQPLRAPAGTPRRTPADRL